MSIDRELLRKHRQYRSIMEEAARCARDLKLTAEANYCDNQANISASVIRSMIATDNSDFANAVSEAIKNSAGQS